jgi:hypothetical protein
MPEQKTNETTRDRLAELLNEDLAREYQAIIAYVVYSQVPCQTRARSCLDPVAPDRLPRQNAGGQP